MELSKRRLDWGTFGVLADFRRCQTACKNTDLIFHCSNGKVSAHQMIFAGISRLFTDLMQRYLIGQELIPLDLNISLPEIRREHMEMVVEVVYTGQVSLTKSDYAPFREICQLLELCLPISDYDDFFMKEEDEEFDEFPEAQVKVSMPLKSWPEPRVFVCDECYAIFPLKIALKRHKKSRHAGPQVPLPNPPDPSEPPKESKPPMDRWRFNKRAMKKGAKNSKNSFYPQNGEPTVLCPDCLNGCRPGRVREHLSHHLREQLMEFVTDSESERARKKCKLCKYEAASASSVCRHLGLSHNMVTKFANEAQRKFLHDARKMRPKPEKSALPSSGPIKVVPKKKKKKLKATTTTDRILENEGFPEIEDQDVEIEIDNALEDATEVDHSEYIEDWP